MKRRASTFRHGWGIILLAVSAHDVATWRAFAATETVNVTGAMLRGLDKTTSRVTELPVAIGKSVTFGTLTITLQDCRKSPPEDPPENAAFLVIDDTKSGDKAGQRIFSGWMFSSSPSVSALEHPIYDIWVVDCTTARASEKSAG